MANSTLMFSGINPEGRNSSKVLRPPGGGSSLGPFSCEEPEEVTRAPVTAPAPVEKELVEAPQVQEPEPAAVSFNYFRYSVWSENGLLTNSSRLFRQVLQSPLRLPSLSQ